MKKNLQISEEEKKHILSKYYLIKESASKRTCVSGNCQNGKGKYEETLSDGKINVYEGNFVNGLRNGNGVLTYPNGDVYSGEFKDDKFDGDGIYKSPFKVLSGEMTLYSGLWKCKENNEGGFSPIPDEDDPNFVVGYGNEYTYKGYFSERGMNGDGYFIFVDDGNAKYKGMLIQTKLDGEISFSGEDPEGNYLETENLIKYHNDKKNKPKEEPEENPEEEPKIDVSDENEVIIPNEIKSKWNGCKTQDKDFWFNGQVPFSKDYGVLTKMPEMGYAKFKGIVDGKQIEFEGCFDKYKMIRGIEKGERGDFSGYYYTEDDSHNFFLGDEKKANKFQYGDLKQSKDYRFHDAEWSYNGFFNDGVINGTNQDVLPGWDKVYGEIKFSDNKVYYGDFVGGKINGNGFFVFPDGMKLEGKFKTEDLEGVKISLLTKNGEFIPDIFEYNQNYKQTKKGESKTIGAIKTSKFNGITKFKIDLESKKTGKKKEFQGLLPKVFIRITNLSDKKIFFEAKSDNLGNFQIPNVPYGKYDLSFSVEENIGKILIFKKSDYVIEKENQKVSVTLKPTKRLLSSLKSDIAQYDRSETKENGIGISSDGSEHDDILSFSNTELINYVIANAKDPETDWVSDLTAGRFEKKYGEVTSQEACLREFKNYANIIRKIQKQEIDPEVLKTPGNDLQPTKNYLIQCVKTYGDKITNKDDVKLVLNPPGDAYGFGIRLENKNKRNIYKDMGLSRTINKVIMEHAEKKKTSHQESKIINNRLKIIAESYNLNRKSERRLAFNELRNEKIKLISLGYDRNIVKESFIDVMKGLFGSTGQDPIADFKKGLSEKLSTPIDLKVIANELDSAIIEEAFKTENPKDLIMETILEKIKEKIDPQIDVVFQNINKKMEDFRNAVGGLQV